MWVEKQRNRTATILKEGVLTFTLVCRLSLNNLLLCSFLKAFSNNLYDTQQPVMLMPKEKRNVELHRPPLHRITILGLDPNTETSRNLLTVWKFGFSFFKCTFFFSFLQVSYIVLSMSPSFISAFKRNDNILET